MNLLAINTGLLWLVLPLSVLAVSPDEGQLSCLVEPNDTSDVSSKVPGIVDRIMVERGDIVRKGMPLFTLEASVEAAAVELAKAQAEFAERKVERNRELFSQELISANERDEIDTDSRVAVLTLREAEARLNQRTTYSPFGGVVVARHISRGEFVSDNPVLTVASLDPMHVEVVLRAEYYGSIKKGMRVEVQPEQPVMHTYSGKVIIVDQVIDAASGTFGVRVEVANPDLGLPSGLKCQVHFIN